MDKPRIVYRDFMAQQEIDKALKLWGAKGILAVALELGQGQSSDAREAVMRHTTQPYGQKILNSVSGRTYVVASMLADRADVLGDSEAASVFEKIANFYGGAVGVVKSAPSLRSTTVVDERDLGFGHHG